MKLGVKVLSLIFSTGMERGITKFCKILLMLMWYLIFLSARICQFKIQNSQASCNDCLLVADVFVFQEKLCHILCQVCIIDIHSQTHIVSEC